LPEKFKCEPDIWLDATSNGLCDVVTQLLKSGFAIDAPHPIRKTTGLMEACRHGHTEMVKLLLTHGAKPSLQAGFDKFSSLHIAITHGHVKCAKLLLAYGTDLTTQDALGRTALHHAVTSEHRTLTDALRLSLIQQLLTYRAPIDAPDIEGATALHYCAIYNRLDCAEMLLYRGANPNAKTQECHLTPCHIAVVESNTDLIRCLLHHGSDPDCKTTQGWSVRSRYPDLCDISPGKQTAS
jgi:ankyrin repeat protein